MKRTIIVLILFVSCLWGQHSDRIFKINSPGDGRYDKEYVDDYFDKSVFIDPYDGKIYLHKYQNYDYYGCNIISDYNGHRIVYATAKINKYGYNVGPNKIWDIGEYGSGNLQFKHPKGVAVTYHDLTRMDIYVADSENNRIVKLRINVLNGNIEAQDYFYATSHGGFNHPTDVEIDFNNNDNPDDDNIYVVDERNHRLVNLATNDGHVRFTYGSYGSGEGNLKFPNAMTLTIDYDELWSDIIVVSDRGNNRLISYWASGGWFYTLDTYNFGGSTDITDIQSDQVHTHVYAVDRMNHKIHKFKAWSTITKRAEYGIEGTGENQLYFPFSISFPVCIPAYDGGYMGYDAIGIIEQWATDSGLLYFSAEGVDILNLSTSVNPDATIMNYSYDAISIGYRTEKIKNLSGGVVRVLADEELTWVGGYRSENWDGKNASGQRVYGDFIFEIYFEQLYGAHYDSITKSTQFAMKPEMSVNISGPSALGFKEYGTWIANISGGVSPYSYQWYKKNDGQGYWSSLGTNSTQTVRMGMVSFTMKVVVTDNLATEAEDTHYVEYIDGPWKVGADELVTQDIPEKYVLEQNHPNPFNPVTKIQFGIPEETNVKLVVYNIKGQTVTTLVDGFLNSGYHYAEFNASNLSSGIYFYKIIAGDFVDLKRMLLIK
jgi:hypothetical protein